MVELMVFFRRKWRFVNWRAEEGGVIAVHMYHPGMKCKGIWRI